MYTYKKMCLKFTVLSLVFQVSASFHIAKNSITLHNICAFIFMLFIYHSNSYRVFRKVWIGSSIKFCYTKSVFSVSRHRYVTEVGFGYSFY